MQDATKRAKRELPLQREELLRALKARFGKNMSRHKGLDWSQVQAKLEANAQKLRTLHEMERTGGEPDVVGRDQKTGEYFFVIVQPKARKVAEAFATTLKRWSQEKKINPEIALLAWRPPWAFSF